MGVTVIGPDQNRVKTGTKTLKDDGGPFTVLLPGIARRGPLQSPMAHALGGRAQDHGGVYIQRCALIDRRMCIG